LNLPYQKYRGYLNKLRYEWKYDHKNERGSKPSKLHCFRAWVLLRGFECPSRVEALRVGWEPTRAKNRFIVFKESLGRVVWFETGLVLVSVRAPGNLGRAKQLFCDAFVNTGLICDIKVMNGVLERVRNDNVHAPYVTGQRLPKLVITDFAESHGIIIKVGDRSHPNAVEVIAGFTESMRSIANFFDDLRMGLNGKTENGNGHDNSGGMVV